jgi:glycosyltransferase involved in cell wall biosynthesis
VILIVGRLRERAAAALDSVLAQDCIGDVEVLLVDLQGDGLREHPNVRVIRMPANTTYSVARLRAIREARAPIVAFLEEHCRVRAGWAAAILRAHEGPYAAVGAEVHNGNPESRLSRIIALMNYNLFLPPAVRREMALLPGHNSSFKRDVLLSYGDELETLLRVEVCLYQRMHADGHRMLLEPDAKFEHINETRLGSIARGYFLWHRCYGPIRARMFHWSLARRWLYILATPAIPIYYLLRLTLVLARTRPALIAQTWLAAPQIYFAQLASAAGQAWGLLFGMSDAEVRFTSYELNEPRT